METQYTSYPSIYWIIGFGIVALIIVVAVHRFTPDNKDSNKEDPYE